MCIHFPSWAFSMYGRKNQISARTEKLSNKPIVSLPTVCSVWN